MRFAVVYSRKDKAGINIVEKLKQVGFIPQIPIIELKKETIYSEFFEKKYPELRNIDFIVFASRHASKESRKTLSLHAPGNWRGADYGGKVGKVCKTSAFILKYLFQQLNKQAEIENLKDYEITLECTHHGPLIDKPCCFIELGSTEEQWKEEKPAKVIAKTILSLQNYQRQNWIPSIGIGGPHYCPNFNKIQLNSEYAISHIIPSYVFPLTESILKEAIKKTEEIVGKVIIDWKSMKSEERKEIINLIENSGLEIKRTSEIKK